MPRFLIEITSATALDRGWWKHFYLSKREAFSFVYFSRGEIVLLVISLYLISSSSITLVVQSSRCESEPYFGRIYGQSVTACIDAFDG